MKKYAPYLILLILFGCIKEPTEPVYEPEPNVMCLLRLDYERQEIRVGKSFGVYEEDPEKWISGAEVKVSCAGETVLFHELPDTPGVYVSESLLVESGNTYFLEVNYPEGNKVTGETTVPQKPRIITPADGDTVSPSQELQWESEGAGGFLLHYSFLNLYDPECNWGVEYFDDLGVNTSITFDSLFIRYAYYTQIVGGEKLTLRIWAVDPNYWDYYCIRKYGEPMETNMHLDGGLGVFGSFVVSDSISVVIKH